MRGGTLRTALVLAASAMSLLGAGEALASHHGEPHRLVIQTIPALKGVPVALDGVKKKSGRRGLAILEHDGKGPLKKRLNVKRARPAPDIRTRFARWYGDPNRQNVKKLTAALDVDYKVGFTFVDRQGNAIDPDDISLMVLRSSVGDQIELDREALTKRHWLHGTRVVSRREGPFAKEILYSVERVVVNGSSVVNRAQQRFTPQNTRDFEVSLLYFTATFRATDALFGHSTGTGILLERPDGIVEEYSFDANGELVLPGLPRGDYVVQVVGPGPIFDRPVTLTRDQEVSLDVLSWLDLTVAALVLGLAVAGLLVIGRPHLARRRKRAQSASQARVLVRRMEQV